MRIRILTIFLLASLIVCTSYAADSAVQTAPAQQEGVPPAPVVLEGNTVFYYRAPLKGVSPEDRASNTVQRLTALAKDYAVPIEDIKVQDTEISTDIVADQHVIAIFTDYDGRAAGTSRLELANQTLPSVKKAIANYRFSHTKEEILKSSGEAAIATLVLIVIIFVIHRTFRFLIAVSVRKIRLPGADTAKLHGFVVNVLRTIRAILILFVVYFYLHSTLAFFPWTRALSLQLLSYIIDPLQTIGSAAVHKIPDLLFIAVLTVVVHYFLKFLRLFFYLIETGKFSLPGFYTEWAKPTYRIVRGLVIAFALVVAFPYVPGSSSEAFKGISIFAGVLFSLGSTSAISNMIAGMILTYMRPYKTGDWVMIGDTMGIVTEMSFLVTRVHTPKNEEISVANSIVLGKDIKNYSNMARRGGLIVHTGVTIGYGSPWRKVHELLISAAVATEGILKEPTPFVLQTALNDFYVAYEINSYTDIPARSSQPQDLQILYSELHKNIQDKFNEGGVEIMSPHYMQLRDGNEPAVPSQYIPRDHVPASLRVLIDGSHSENKK